MDKIRNLSVTQKYIIILIISFVLLLLLQFTQPHLYEKKVNVTITNIEKQHWSDISDHYKVVMTVHNDDYNLNATITNYGTATLVGLMTQPDCWNYKTGDVVKAKLYSWGIGSSDIITRREIVQIY